MFLGGVPRPVLIISAMIAVSLLGDSALYVILPANFPQRGLTPISVGLLLSINRWVRLLTNVPAAWLLGTRPIRSVSRLEGQNPAGMLWALSFEAHPGRRSSASRSASAARARSCTRRRPTWACCCSRAPCGARAGPSSGWRASSRSRTRARPGWPRPGWPHASVSAVRARRPSPATPFSPAAASHPAAAALHPAAAASHSLGAAS